MRRHQGGGAADVSASCAAPRPSSRVIEALRERGLSPRVICDERGVDSGVDSSVGGALIYQLEDVLPREHAVSLFDELVSWDGWRVEEDEFGPQVCARMRTHARTQIAATLSAFCGE